jgi:hypothetical protein
MLAPCAAPVGSIHDFGTQNENPKAGLGATATGVLEQIGAERVGAGEHNWRPCLWRLRNRTANSPKCGLEIPKRSFGLFQAPNGAPRQSKPLRMTPMRICIAG